MKRMLKRLIYKFFITLDPIFGIDDYENHTFYSPTITKDSDVVDLGSCLGDFAEYLTNKYSCRAVTVEASPQLFDEIPTNELTTKLNYAMGGEDGVATFFVSDKIEAGTICKEKPNTKGQIQVPACSLGTLLTETNITKVALMKVDIEGAEIEMIRTAPQKVLTSVDQINIEFHDKIKFPATSTEDVEEIIAKLNELGFAGFDLGRKGFNWLFLNKNLKVKPKSYMYIRLRSRFKNVMGDSSMIKKPTS